RHTRFSRDWSSDVCSSDLHDRSISEDPLLTAAIGAQYVNGIEGKDQDGNLLPEAEGYLKATTAPKHYAAHNSYVDLHTGSSDMDDRTLREYYTAQFRHIIEQSDPRSMMSSYKALNGTPAAANVYLTDTLTRQT